MLDRVRILGAVLLCVGCSEATSPPDVIARVEDPPLPIPTVTVQVTMITSGEGLPASYLVTMDGGPPQSIAANGTVSFTSTSPRDHTVVLSEVADNCDVNGGE